MGNTKLSVRFSAIIACGVLVLSLVASTLSSFRAEASISNPVVGSSVFGVGDDYSGALGNGTEDMSTSGVKFQLPTGVTVQKLVQTQANIVVLGSDDQVYSAGRNANGEFGIGTQELQSTPVKFALPVGVSANDVAAYYEDGTNTEDAIFVLGSDGNVYGAGSNMYGILGNGGPVGVETTPVVFQLPGGVIAQAMYPQKRNMFVLGSDGNLYGAGENGQGELGNGTTGRTATPVVFQLPGGVSALKVAWQRIGIDNVTTVIADDGNVYSAGLNSYGMFGDGTSSPTSTPTVFQLPGGEVAEDAWVSSGFIAVKTVSGKLFSSGDNGSGQLGDGTGADTTTPVEYALPGGVTVASYVPSSNDAAQGVIGSDGKLYIAGSNYYGIIGDGTYDDALSPTEFPLPGGVQAIKAQLGDSSLVLGDDGNAYVTGGNWWGQTGTGAGTLDNEYLTPQRFGSPVGQNVTDIELNAAEAAYASFVVAAGSVYGAGINASGGIGSGSLNDYEETPIQMQLPSGVVPKGVHANFHGKTANTCIISTVDELYCVGINLYGQLGSGQQVTYAATAQNFELPAGVSAVKMISAYDSVFVLGTDGNVYGAGDNSYGQLGDGTTNPAYTPVIYGLPGGVSAVNIFRTGLTFISVLGDDGTLYSAGNNYSGMFGAGVTGQQSTPVEFQLPGGVSVADVAKTQVGGGTTPLVVIGDDGNVYAAGTNSYGQVGSGSVTSSITTPQMFILPGGVTAVAASTDPSGTYVLGSDGNVYGAGRNNYGQLGDGSMTLRRSPVVFVLPGGVTAEGVVNDRESTYVLGSDGNVYGAGRNNYGQLGDGSSINRSTPVQFQIPGGETVGSINDILPFQQQRVSVQTTAGSVYSAGNNSLNDYDAVAHAPFGNGTPNSIQSTPVEFQLPGGVTAAKLATGSMLFNLAVIGSDGNLYAAGVNLAGFSASAPYASSLPVQMELPNGESVVTARSEYSATFVITDQGNLYSAGCNSFTVATQDSISGCAGWFGTGSYLSESTPQLFGLSAGLQVTDIDLEVRDRLFVTTETAHAAGGQLFCDANDSGTFDSGESYVNGESVDLYAASGGVATGSPLASYATATYSTYDGTFFFDGLPEGDYIVGHDTGSGTVYTAPFTIDGTGDGWILGSNTLINSVSDLAQPAADCAGGGSGGTGGSGGSGSEGGSGSTEDPTDPTAGDEEAAPLADTGQVALFMLLVALTFVVGASVSWKLSQKVARL